MPTTIIPGSQFDINTPQSRVKLDAGSLMGKSRGMQAIAAAAGDVGDVAMDIGKDMQRAKDTKIVAEASLRMSQAHSSLIESFQNDPNHDEWEQRAKETSTQVKQDIYGNNRVSPALKRQLDLSLNGWAGNLQITAKTAANVQRVNQAWSASQTAIADALNNGNLDQATNVLNMAKGAKIVDPVVAQKMQAEFPKKIAISQIETGALTNPKKTFDDLGKGEWKALDPKTREQLTAQVAARMHTWQAQNLDEVRADYDSGKIVTDDDIQKRVEAGDITARGGDSLKAFIAGKTLAVGKEAYQLMNGEVLTHDVTADKTPEAWVSQVKADAAALPTMYRNMLIRSVDNKMAQAKRQDAKQEKPVEAETYARMKKDFEEGFDLPGTQEMQSTGEWLKPWTWGDKKPTDKILQPAVKSRKEWEQNATEDERRAAHLHYAQQLGQIQEFFKQNPNASYEQAEDFRQKISRPYLIESVSKALAAPMSSAAQPNISKAEYEALPAGSSYWWNGQKQFKK